MSPAAPGNSELMRAIEALRTDFRDLAARLDAGYVRRDVYQADRNADAIQAQGIEAEVHALGKTIERLTMQRDSERDTLIQQLQSGRRWVVGLGVSAFIGPVLTVLITKAIGL